MLLKIQFEGGQSRYGTEAVNFLMPLPPELQPDEEAREFLESTDADLYREMILPYMEDGDECELYGYDEMADSLAAELTKCGINLHDVEWWYGSNPDGTPKHVE